MSAALAALRRLFSPNRDQQVLDLLVLEALERAAYQDQIDALIIATLTQEK